MVAQFLISSIKLPKALILIASFTKKCLFWIFVEHVTASIVEPSNKEETSLNKEDIKKESPIDLLTDKESKCNFCGRCFECEQKKDKEDKKKKEKEEKDSNVLALNYFAFIVMFLIIFICNMAIWISIGS